MKCGAAGRCYSRVQDGGGGCHMIISYFLVAVGMRLNEKGQFFSLKKLAASFSEWDSFLGSEKLTACVV